MATGWPCPLCKRTITGARAKSNHHKNLWKARNDDSRCDNKSKSNVPIIMTPVLQPSDEPVAGPPTAASVTFAVGIVNDEPVATLYDLARRQYKDIKTARSERKQYMITCVPVSARSGTFNMLRTQNAWDRQVCSISVVWTS